MAHPTSSQAKSFATKASTALLSLGMASSLTAAPLIGGLPDVIDNSNPVVIIETVAERAALNNILANLSSQPEPAELAFDTTATQVIVNNVSANGRVLTANDGNVYIILPFATHQFINGDAAPASLIQSAEQVGLLSNSPFNENGARVVHGVLYGIH